MAEGNTLADGKRTVYARNCSVRSIDKATASAFLQTNHLFGHASCRYRYALERGGEIVAVATFSQARRWDKDGRTVSSYEWVRYASLKDITVVGGMGKLLRHFINECSPDDVMSYAPTRFHTGAVYERLGFVREGEKCFGESTSIKFRLKLTQY